MAVLATILPGSSMVSMVSMSLSLGALLASGAPDLPVDLLGFAIPLVLVAAVVPFGVAAFVVA